MDSHLAFDLPRSSVVDRILVPKYYDPDLAAALSIAEESGFDTPELGDLLLPGDQGSRLGDWVPREHYGSGAVPYVRTSDLWHWQVRPDFKKGLSEAVYDRYSERQDVAVGDILMVAHGSYLIGTCAIVTPERSRLVLQDHVFRLRLDPDCGVDSHWLLAALSTSFVRRQVRARQFSADIIDKIGDRHKGIRVPIPRDTSLLEKISDEVRDIITEQTVLRARSAGLVSGGLGLVPARTDTRLAFPVHRSSVENRILIPRYYDPDIEAGLEEAKLASAIEWTTVGSLISEGSLAATTGVEVGKMAYGTGTIPFIRTSDIAEWEIKRDPKQGVSAEIYSEYATKAGVQKDDILLVRDGTYLVGSSALLGEDDSPALFCGGVYRFRSLDHERCDPATLLAYLNLPIVRRQMRSKQFTRDVIDTLGKRVFEVQIPTPNATADPAVSSEVRHILDAKEGIKRRIGDAILGLEPPVHAEARGRPGWSMR